MNIHLEIFEEIKIPTVVLVENSKERLGHETVLKSWKTYLSLTNIINQSKYSYDKVEGELGGRGELEEEGKLEEEG